MKEVEAGGRKVRMRARTVRQEREVYDRYGWWEVEWQITTIASMTAAGKGTIDPGIALLNEQVGKRIAADGRHVDDALLLAAMEPADGGDPLTEDWLLDLPRDEYRALKVAELEMNKTMVDPWFVAKMQIPPRLKLTSQQTETFVGLMDDIASGKWEDKVFRVGPEATTG